MPWKNPPPRMIVRLSPGIDKRIRALAKRRGVSINATLERLVLIGLKRLRVSSVEELRDYLTLRGLQRPCGTGCGLSKVAAVTAEP